MEELKTIDLKMNWTTGLAYVRAGLEHGTEEGKRLANEYINDMAKLLDHGNEKLERALADVQQLREQRQRNRYDELPPELSMMVDELINMLASHYPYDPYLDNLRPKIPTATMDRLDQIMGDVIEDVHNAIGKLRAERVDFQTPPPGEI
tara:strand:+ start:369 stop:815 length:447 start_codon:yes stop_codon:yes gene_type:complete